MSNLYLGPVSFQDFEIPARITFGGRQILAIHQLPGGARVIDAIGRDDAPLAWAGTFSGPDAAARALQLDLMRAQGLSWLLSWDVLSYLVVISEFVASYERENWIPYRIACSVIVDETAVLPLAVLSLAQGVVADLASAAGLAGVNLASATAALADPSAVVPGSAAFASATGTLAGASAGVAAGLVTQGTTLVGAADFPTAAAAAQQCAELAAAQGYVQRAQTNLANAGT